MKRRIDSACDTARFAASTATCISARSASVVREVGERRRRDRGLRPAGHGVRVQRDQSGDERPSVTDDQALADEGMGADEVLQQAGATFLPPAVTRISLLAPGHPDEPLVVDLADVAGAQPPVSRETSDVASSLPQ